jgi:hypothetical protein
MKLLWIDRNREAVRDIQQSPMQRSWDALQTEMPHIDMELIMPDDPRYADLESKHCPWGQVPYFQLIRDDGSIEERRAYMSLDRFREWVN